MEGWQLSILIESYAVNAEIEAMKTENRDRSENNLSQAYPEQSFRDAEAELLRLSRDIKG